MKGGAQVYFVDPYVKHMQAVEREGLHMELEEQEEETVKITMAVSDASKAGICDLVILLVKGMNTKSSIEANRELFGEDTVVISLQNGLGNVDILKEFFPHRADWVWGVKSICHPQSAGKNRRAGKISVQSQGRLVLPSREGHPIPASL